MNIQARWHQVRQHPGAVLALLAVWLLLPLGWRPLMLPDEGRYVGVAWGMLARGDWLTPTLHGLPYFHKPPLMYWIDAAALGLFGAHAWPARLAPAFGAWLMGAALYLDWRDRFGAETAAGALATLAVTPLFFFAGQFANLDMLVAGCITATVLAAVRAIEAAPGAHRIWLVLFGLGGGLGLLAKGLIGLVLPMLVLVPWLAWRGDVRRAARLLNPLGWGVALAVAAPWFLAMQHRFAAFADYFFLEQHVRRYAEAGFNNAQPWWFFPVALVVLTLPWSAGAWTAWRHWRAGVCGREGRAVSSDYGRLLGIWVVAVLLFFSVPRSKLVGYVLPALAPWLGLLAVPMVHGRRWRWTLGAMAVLGLGATLALAGAHTPSHRDVGETLARSLQDGEPVVFVDGPYFDVPFYARLRQAPYVLADWRDPRWARKDDWHKELLDAARFAPPADAARLIGPEQAGTLACTAPRAWWLVPPQWTPPAEQAARFRRVQGGRSAELWESQAQQAAGSCP